MMPTCAAHAGGISDTRRCQTYSPHLVRKVKRFPVRDDPCAVPSLFYVINKRQVVASLNRLSWLLQLAFKSSSFKFEVLPTAFSNCEFIVDFRDLG